MASLSELSLVLSEESTIRLPTLTMRPPISDGSTRGIERDVLAERRLERVLERGDMRVGERLGAGHLGGDLAAVLGDEPAEGGDDLRVRATSRRFLATTLKKLATVPPMPAWFEHRLDGADLLLGGVDRAPDEGLEIVALVMERGEAADIVLEFGQRLVVLGEFEQGGRVAFRDARKSGKIFSPPVSASPTPRGFFREARPLFIQGLERIWFSGPARSQPDRPRAPKAGVRLA